jgi:phosphoinositide-3-kinase regulatory subunit 4
VYSLAPSTGGLPEKRPPKYEPIPVDDIRPEVLLEQYGALQSSKDSGPAITALTAGTDAFPDGAADRAGFLVTGGMDHKIRFWDLAHPSESTVISGLDLDEPSPAYLVGNPTPSCVKVVEQSQSKQEDGGDAAAGSKGAAKKSSRSTVLTLGQHLDMRRHLDAVCDVALLEAPYGMVVSGDRGGGVMVWQ